MKAAYLIKPGQMEIRSEKKPEPSVGEVLLRVKAVGVCGSDVHYYREGRIGNAVVKEPLILGHEFSGVIEKVGPGVEGLCAGSRVAVEPGVACGNCWWCARGQYNLCPDISFCGTPPIHGAYREHMAYPAKWCWPISDKISYADGAMLEPLAVAIHAVDEGAIRTGACLLIVGAGSIGLTILQAARAAGALKVFVSEPLAYRRKLALKMGADLAINPNTEDVVQVVNRETRDRGVDVAFEAAGAMETYQLCIEAVRRGGTAVFVGIPSLDSIPLDIHPARRKGVTIKNLRRFVNTYERAISLVEAGRVDVSALVTHTFKLEKIVDAFELVADYGDGVMKAVIKL